MKLHSSQPTKKSIVANWSSSANKPNQTITPVNNMPLSENYRDLWFQTVFDECVETYYEVRLNSGIIPKEENEVFIEWLRSEWAMQTNSTHVNEVMYHLLKTDKFCKFYNLIEIIIMQLHKDFEPDIYKMGEVSKWIEFNTCCLISYSKLLDIASGDTNIGLKYRLRLEKGFFGDTIVTIHNTSYLIQNMQG
ncbi:MAG: hypothetical protein KAS32_31230 [Candidatus Peribacteraceae bacterium]|nr:hypothetical protein [Candidatus Peribacteraceae bacterium]